MRSEWQLTELDSKLKSYRKLEPLAELVNTGAVLQQLKEGDGRNEKNLQHFSKLNSWDWEEK